MRTKQILNTRKFDMSFFIDAFIDFDFEGVIYILIISMFQILFFTNYGKPIPFNAFSLILLLLFSRKLKSGRWLLRKFFPLFTFWETLHVLSTISWKHLISVDRIEREKDESTLGEIHNIDRGHRECRASWPLFCFFHLWLEESVQGGR